MGEEGSSVPEAARLQNLTQITQIQFDNSLITALRLPFGLPFPFGINGRRLSIARACSFSAFGLHHWSVASTSWLSRMISRFNFLSRIIGIKELYLLDLLNLREIMLPFGLDLVVQEQ